MESLAGEIKRQRDRLEEVPEVKVYLDLDAVHPDRPYQGSVDVYATSEHDEIYFYLDLYTREGSFEIKAVQVGADWTDTFRRSTTADTLLKVSALVHSFVGRRVELDRAHWPPCRVVCTREHLTARRDRFSSTVTFRGDWFECREYLQEQLPPEGPPTDFDFQIKGDIPPKHTVEEPPSGPDWLHADGNVDDNDGEVELPF